MPSPGPRLPHRTECAGRGPCRSCSEGRRRRRTLRHDSAAIRCSNRSLRAGLSCQTLQIEVGDDLAQGLKMDLCIHRSGRDAAMPEVIANSLHRQAVVEEMLGGGVPEHMRPAAPGLDTKTIQPPSDDLRESTGGVTVGSERGGSGTGSVQATWGGHRRCSARLPVRRRGTADRDRFVPPCSGERISSPVPSQGRPVGRPHTSPARKPYPMRSTRIARSRLSAGRSPSVLASRRRTASRDNPLGIVSSL